MVTGSPSIILTVEGSGACQPARGTPGCGGSARSCPGQVTELVVAQTFTPSDFDWRIGVLGSAPLFACRYHMARGHWQIQKALGKSERLYGKTETLRIEDAPKAIVALAVRASALIGDGLYGVDIKDVDGRLLVMEVNDNPSIEAGTEDEILKDDLYLAIMQSIYDRLERRGRH